MSPFRPIGTDCCSAGCGCSTDSCPPRPPMPPRRPMRRCTAATRCGPPRCRRRSPGAAATAVRCRSIGMRRSRCSPNTRWTCSRCCHWASCGWPPHGCARSTGCSTPLTEAFALLESLGNPVLWSVPLHWAGVHAGILASSPEAVAPHGQALTAAAAHSAFAKALATAGRTWLRVLANHVDIDEVTAAARGLSQFGLTWDATRLASQAALQTPDGRVSGAMLQLARDLKQTVAVDDAAGPRVGDRRRGWHPRGPSRPVLLEVVRPRARSRRTAAARHAVPRHRQPAVHLGQDRRAPCRADPAPARRRVAIGDVVDAARHAGSPGLSPQRG